MPGAAPERAFLLEAAALAAALQRRSALADGEGTGGSAPGRGDAATGTEPRELGPWQPGDDARRIDWRASARRGEWVMRRYDAEPRRAWRVLVDASGSMRTAGAAPGEDAGGPLTLACRVATVVALVGARSWTRVTVEALGGPPVLSLAPGGARDAAELAGVAGALGQLATAEERGAGPGADGGAGAGAGASPLEAALEALAAGRGGPAHGAPTRLVVLSDFLTEDRAAAEEPEVVAGRLAAALGALTRGRGGAHVDLLCVGGGEAEVVARVARAGGRVRAAEAPARAAGARAGRTRADGVALDGDEAARYGAEVDRWREALAAAVRRVPRVRWLEARATPGWRGLSGAWARGLGAAGRAGA